MLLLVTKGLPQLRKLNDPNVGRLFTPRHVNAVAQTVEAGIPWAADNDAFVSFQVGPYLRMLSHLAGMEGCLFVTAPDVVGDAKATTELFARWHPIIRDCRLPIAYVLQDGVEEVPWDDCDAVFIGGSTTFKLGSLARKAAVEAHRRGLWVHMGRVNTARRFEYAAAIECDSVDGTQFSQWFDRWIGKGQKWSQFAQGMFE